MSPDRGCDPQDRGLMVGRGTGKTGDPKLCPPASRWWWPRCPCTGSCRSPSSTPGPQICSWKAQDDTHTHKTPRPQPQGWRTPSDKSLHQGGTWKRLTIENISNHLTHLASSTATLRSSVEVGTQEVKPPWQPPLHRRTVTWEGVSWS